MMGSTLEAKCTTLLFVGMLTCRLSLIEALLLLPVALGTSSSMTGLLPAAGTPAALPALLAALPAAVPVRPLPVPAVKELFLPRDGAPAATVGAGAEGLCVTDAALFACCCCCMRESIFATILSKARAVSPHKKAYFAQFFVMRVHNVSIVYMLGSIFDLCCTTELRRRQEQH